METKFKEILIIFTFTWFISTLLSLSILMIYWGIITTKIWAIELTLISCWNFGILGIIVGSILISIFLSRYKIVRKN